MDAPTAAAASSAASQTDSPDVDGAGPSGESPSLGAPQPTHAGRSGASARTTKGAAADKDDDDEDAPETAVVEWIAARIAREAERVRGCGQRCVAVPVKNCGLVIEGGGDDGDGASRPAPKRLGAAAGAGGGGAKAPSKKGAAKKAARRAKAAAGAAKAAAASASAGAAPAADGDGSAPAAAAASAPPPPPPVTWHRLEANTGFDFDRAANLLYSDAEPVPVKRGYVYRTVVVLVDATGAAPALLLPYVHAEAPGLRMSHWRLLNNALKATDIVVEGAQDVGGGSGAADDEGDDGE